MMLRRQRQSGFTLVEVLIAWGIVAIILALAYQGISRAAGNRVSIEKRFDRFQEIQLAMRILSKDIAQLQPRPVRDLLGQGQLPSIMTGESNGGIELTVGGHRNPLNLARSEQQRVAYEIEEDKLFRSQWQVLDRTQGSLPIRRPLLEGVNAISVRFMNRQLEWQDSWPPPDSESFRDIPKAVEITLELDDMGLIRRVIEVVG